MKATTSSIILVLIAAAVAPAHAETIGEKTGVNSVLGITPTTRDFVTEAANSDMFEISSSKLALERTNGETKTFAERMIKDHSMTTSQLKALAEKAHVALPTKLDGSHQSMLNELKDAKGDDFAKLYHKDQDKGHDAAVSLFKRYAKAGDNPQLKAWASKTLPTLESHYAMAKRLDQ